MVFFEEELWVYDGFAAAGRGILGDMIHCPVLLQMFPLMRRKKIGEGDVIWGSGKQGEIFSSQF